MGMPDTADVVVVGSGITGAATAAAVAARGAAVVLVDKEDGPAREGSGRAQGSLRLQGRHPSEFPLAQESLQMWGRAAQEDPGHDIELATGGNLYFCTSETEKPLLMSLVGHARAAGLTGVEYLDRDRTREIVPAAAGPFLGAMWSPVDAQCQPDKGTRLFVRRAERAGARFAYGVKATRLLESRGQITGVQTTRGRVAAGTVVVAAGIWTPHLLNTAGITVPLMPVCLSEVQTQALAPLFRPTIRAFGFGARQRPDGRIVVSGGLGARVTRRVSLYDLGGLRYWLPRARMFRKNLRLRVDGAQILREIRHRTPLSTALIPQPSPEPAPDRPSVDAALSRLAAVFPGAAEARAVRYWAGLVDMTPDGLPVIDGTCGPLGLTVVTGLSGHGLALGPVLGEIASDLALDGSTDRPIEPFSLARFTDKVASPGVMI
jgi:glycine/D-amino acid oxidase-like deaminating enzyme